jgi:dephospho-CoA kinase
VKNKFIIVLTGSIATGKSVISNILENLGANIIDTDIIARKIVEIGSPVFEKIKNTWGVKILKENGELNREMLGNIIFSSKKEREKLNNLMHPEIIKVIKQDIKKSDKTVNVLVIPLFFEVKIDFDYDEIWLAYCDEKTQKKRLKKRNNLSSEEAIKRIKSQIPINEKLKLADVVIYNCYNKIITLKNIEKAWEKTKTKLKRRDLNV